MRAPNFDYKIFDQTQKPEIPVVEQPQPLFLAAVSSDKGPEEMRLSTSKDFANTYLTDKNLFQKHGQPLLQVANIINNGGKVLLKRVVAEDATLANLTVLGKIAKEEVQKKDADGNLLFIDASTGKETIESVGNQAIMINVCKVSYEFVSLENKKSLNDIYVAIDNTYDQQENVFPLFTIADIGRGKSMKKFIISPNHNDSRYKKYMLYNICVLEQNTVLENIPFTLDPDIIEAGTNRSLSNMVNSLSQQIKCKLYEGELETFIEEVAKASGNEVDYIKSNDILFGFEKKGSPALKGLTVELTDETDLSYMYGLDLKHGDNGAFGDKPIGTDAYKTQLIKFFSGEYDSNIFDLDNYKIDLIVDANYPAEVKREIEKLTDFRKDLFYFRDLGIGLRTVEDIIAADVDSAKTMYASSYEKSYDIIDPYTKKQITVTGNYTLARLLINHFKYGRNRPIAGEYNNMVFNDAIEGTVNFIPKKTPDYDHKTMLTDAKINYASYFDGKLILETIFTSQEDFTDLSFIHNILATQEVIKAIRTHCPKARYKFIDGKDLDKYKDDVDIVIQKFAHNFKSLKFVYLEDETMVANKVFYAAIEIVYRDFVQSEFFNVYALNANTLI